MDSDSVLQLTNYQQIRNPSYKNTILKYFINGKGIWTKISQHMKASVTDWTLKWFHNRHYKVLMRVIV